MRTEKRVERIKMASNYLNLSKTKTKKEEFYECKLYFVFSEEERDKNLLICGEDKVPCCTMSWYKSKLHLS